MKEVFSNLIVFSSSFVNFWIYYKRNKKIETKFSFHFNAALNKSGPTKRPSQVVSFCDNDEHLVSREFFRKEDNHDCVQLLKFLHDIIKRKENRQQTGFTKRIQQSYRGLKERLDICKLRFGWLLIRVGFAHWLFKFGEFGSGDCSKTNVFLQDPARKTLSYSTWVCCNGCCRRFNCKNIHWQQHYHVRRVRLRILLSL